jgi:hypothetical protein
LYALLIFAHLCYTPRSFHRYVMKFLIMQSSPASRLFLRHRSKYSPQHRELRHSRAILLPEFQGNYDWKMHDRIIVFLKQAMSSVLLSIPLIEKCLI